MAAPVAYLTARPAVKILLASWSEEGCNPPHRQASSTSLVSHCTISPSPPKTATDKRALVRGRDFKPNCAQAVANVEGAIIEIFPSWMVDRQTVRDLSHPDGDIRQVGVFVCVLIELVVRIRHGGFLALRLLGRIC